MIFNIILRSKIEDFCIQATKTANIEKPSKTIVFPRFFEGRALEISIEIVSRTKQKRNQNQDLKKHQFLLIFGPRKTLKIAF